jgi:protein-S-isoprenylcysteine O-methyltransferase Ste14
VHSELTDRHLPAVLFAGAAGARAADLFVSLGEVSGLMLLNGVLAVLFCALAAALLLVRGPRRGARAGPLATSVALVGTLAMNGVLVQPPAASEPWVLALGNGLVAVGLAFSLYAAASLGRCFGVAPEARGIVTSGAYGLVRHPLYLGEMVAAFGVVVAAASPWSVLVFGLFCACQAGRAVLEERALAEAFPAYAEYRRGTPALLPGFGLLHGNSSRPHCPPESV